MVGERAAHAASAASAVRGREWLTHPGIGAATDAKIVRAAGAPGLACAMVRSAERRLSCLGLG